MHCAIATVDILVSPLVVVDVLYDSLLFLDKFGRVLQEF